MRMMMRMMMRMRMTMRMLMMMMRMRMTMRIILLLMLGVKVAGRCRAGFEGSTKVWYLLALMMKVGFCVTLCARLEQLTNLRLLIICVPLWTLLTGALIQLGYNILPQSSD
uniref:Uncharacterized protein n=1 Tax=Sinocyclocheilus grahami TaxID=75366 RepID=A0A672LEY0_SINGR